MSQIQSLAPPSEESAPDFATVTETEQVRPSNYEQQLHRPLEPTPADVTAQQRFNLSSYPPPSYTQCHDSPSLSFPDAPKTELPPIQSHPEARGANNSLPSLSSVTGPQPAIFGHSRTLSSASYSPPPIKEQQWPSMNPLTTFYTPSHAADSPQRMDVDRSSSVSLDDPDVRMAAEALGDLRADFVSSPPKRHSPLPPTSSPRGYQPTKGPEPLLSLLTTSHPILANTLGTANKAYANSKKTYPRFKSGAEYIEGYLSPVASTVGSVGRKTGVDGGIRWFLGAGRRQASSSSDLEAGGDRQNHKRRKMGGTRSPAPNSLDALADRALAASPSVDSDMYGFSKERRNSISTVDTLPAYDDSRSPAYTDGVEPQNQVASRPSSAANGPWQQRLIMSTSGLSIAMSDESLRSLKYCLHWLRWANEHIGKVIAALRLTLQQYDGGENTRDEQAQSQAMTDGLDRKQLAARINELKTDVLKTMREVIETVSKYAGGALPENARDLVRKHLTSLPQRFRIATMQDASAQPQSEDAKEQEVREGAQRVLVLAKEGLDMMEQVSGVLDGTIVSAEEWCERLGKNGKKKSDTETLTKGEKEMLPYIAPPPVQRLADETMN